jgi:hypothetical protein
MTNLYTILDCSCNPHQTKVVGCITCPSGTNILAPGIKEVIQKRIQHQVRAPASAYTMNLGALTIAGPFQNKPVPKYHDVNWNQSSDRNRPANSLISMKYRRNVPSHGNSTKFTLTRNRPGASAPGGEGVDIKHNSYYRYLGRLKSKSLKTGPIANTPTRTKGSKIGYNPTFKGNKLKNYGMVAGCKCCDCCVASGIYGGGGGTGDEGFIIQWGNEPLAIHKSYLLGWVTQRGIDIINASDLNFHPALLQPDPIMKISNPCPELEGVVMAKILNSDGIDTYGYMLSVILNKIPSTGCTTKVTVNGHTFDLYAQAPQWPTSSIPPISDGSWIGAVNPLIVTITSNDNPLINEDIYSYFILPGPLNLSVEVCV